MPGLFFGEGNGEGNGQGNGGNALWTGLGSAPLSEPLNVAVRWKTFLPTSGQYGYPDRWWSPMLRAQVVMGEFADKGGLRAVTLAAPNNDPAQMADEIFKLAQKFAHRELRLPEIIAQSDSFVDYWYQLLMADNGRRPNTATLVQVGVAVGGLVAMYQKDKHKRLRPAQVYPALTPVIPTPPHPSYPSGHSTQAHLIWHCVRAGMPDTIGDAMDDVMQSLAGRIAENREIAGVHFESDTAAGKNLAQDIIAVLKGQVDTFKTLTNAALSEWQDLTPSNAVAIPALPSANVDIADISDATVQKIVNAVAAKLQPPSGAST